MIEMVRPQVERYEWVYAPLVGPGYEATFDEHQAIIRSLRDKSGTRAHDKVEPPAPYSAPSEVAPAQIALLHRPDNTPFRITPASYGRQLPNRARRHPPDPTRSRRPPP